MTVINQKQPNTAIRKITVAAMQRRFTLKEELALKQANDEVANIMTARLFNASHCDLNFQDTRDGVAYIVNLLSQIDDPENAGEKIIPDPVARIDELLKDGTEDEV